jgi:HK97 gp10 family phage protein
MPRSNQSLQAALQELDVRLQRMIQAGISSTYESAGQLADEGKAEVQRLIRHKGSYKPYFTKDGKPRMSSMPGEPPATEVGNELDKSIVSVRISRRNENPAKAAFGSTAGYAPFLEFGTTKMEPRPFMRPARDHVRSIAGGIVANNFYKNMINKAKKMRRQNVRLEF